MVCMLVKKMNRDKLLENNKKNLKWILKMKMMKKLKVY